MGQKKVSLIFTSNNRKPDLIRFVESINKQKNFDLRLLELIFIDQGVNNEVFEILDSQITLKYLNSNLVPLSLARNIGLSEVTGDLVGFPDDDCYYDENFLSRLSRSFEQKTDVLCVHVYDPVTNTDLGGRPRNIRTVIDYSNILKLPISVGIFIRGEILRLEKLTFDEKFGAGNPWGAGEESDLLLKIMKLNKYSFLYDGYMSVYHPVIDYQEKDIEKVGFYAKGMGALLAKHRHSSIKLYKYFLEMIVRGLAGCIINIGNFRFNVYRRRTIGLLKGYREGKAFYENNS
jgi:glycosyltransferase involved in cell wall biosynthesis